MKTLLYLLIYLFCGVKAAHCKLKACLYENPITLMLQAELRLLLKIRHFNVHVLCQ